jgi:site-specific DNA-adenine methylase
MLGKVEKNLFGEDHIVGEEDEILFKLIFDLPINWVGNKKRMLSRLLAFINKHEVEHETFFDVFSGSGVVSALAAASGKKVFSNDLLVLSSTWVQQLLSGKTNVLSSDECLEILNAVKQDIEQPSQVGFLSDLYKGTLITKEEVAYLDAYRRVVAKFFGPYMSVGHRLNGSVYSPAYINLNSGEVEFENITGNPEKVTFAMQMMCVHILQQAFMGGRCYQNQLLAKAEKRLQDGKVGTYGNSNSIGNESHLIKLLRPKTCPMKGISNFLSNKGYESTIFNCDAESLIASNTIQADLAYFDPPYGGSNSDYLWMYMVCEGFLTGKRIEECLSLRENAVKFKGEGYERDKSFSKKVRKGYTENFSSMLEASKDFPNWVISFNESSFAPIDRIIDVVSSFRKDFVAETVDGYRYNYRDRSVKKGSEYVILARG